METLYKLTSGGGGAGLSYPESADAVCPSGSVTPGKPASSTFLLMVLRTSGLHEYTALTALEFSL